MLVLLLEKVGENLRKIREETFWTCEVKRVPNVRSRTVDSMRAVEFQESEYRRKFLNNVGRKIYGGWKKDKIKNWARVSFLGSGMQIGRSCLYLQTNESRILLDCGVSTGVSFGDSQEFPFLSAPEFKIEDIDAVVLSHAHMDHIGFLPYLFKMGYRGPVYCTPPTRDIMVLSQLDYIKIRSSFPNVENIYKAEDIKEMVKHVITLNYKEVTDITPDIRLTFYNAGHVLGSSFCHINIGNGEHNFLYTGDINFSYKQRLLQQADYQFPRIESMLLESTNVDGTQKMSREESEEKLLEIITTTYVNSGKVLIPTFGIGRSQEILLVIEHLISSKRLPEDLKVYCDGMVFEVTALHTYYPEFLNFNLMKRILKNDNPFLCPNISQVGSYKEREKIFESNEPCVVIATSGMLNGGTSVEYFKNFAPEKRKCDCVCRVSS